jgi:hypothetical protein
MGLLSSSSSSSSSSFCSETLNANPDLMRWNKFRICSNDRLAVFGKKR